jgi:hypothetical protein
MQYLVGSTCYTPDPMTPARSLVLVLVALASLLATADLSWGLALLADDTVAEAHHSCGCDPRACEEGRCCCASPRDDAPGPGPSFRSCSGRERPALQSRRLPSIAPLAVSNFAVDMAEPAAGPTSDSSPPASFREPPGKIPI